MIIPINLRGLPRLRCQRARVDWRMLLKRSKEVSPFSLKRRIAFRGKNEHVLL